MSKDAHFNGLTPAEAERLALLSEECGEVIHIIGKIQRHGLHVLDPAAYTGPSNRRLLELECGDVRAAMIRLCNAQDLSKERIHNQAAAKLEHTPYLHHQNEE